MPSGQRQAPRLAFGVYADRSRFTIELQLRPELIWDLSLSEDPTHTPSGDSRQSCAYMHQPVLVEGWTVQRGMEAGVTLSLQL